MAFTSIEMDEIGNREEAIVLFQIYGENAGYQLLGWLMVFVGLIVLNELSRRTEEGRHLLLPNRARRTDGVFHLDLCRRGDGSRVGAE